MMADFLKWIDDRAPMWVGALVWMTGTVLLIFWLILVGALLEVGKPALALAVFAAPSVVGWYIAWKQYKRER